MQYTIRKHPLYFGVYNPQGQYIGALFGLAKTEVLASLEDKRVYSRSDFANMDAFPELRVFTQFQIETLSEHCRPKLAKHT